MIILKRIVVFCKWYDVGDIVFEIHRHSPLNAKITCTTSYVEGFRNLDGPFDRKSQWSKCFWVPKNWSIWDKCSRPWSTYGHMGTTRLVWCEVSWHEIRLWWDNDLPPEFKVGLRILVSARVIGGKVTRPHEIQCWPWSKKRLMGMPLFGHTPQFLNLVPQCPLTCCIYERVVMIMPM